jgi:hypothetical protein
MGRFPNWLEGARTAPSRFNAQPWRFDLEANGEIVVGWDAARTLPASDPIGRDLFISLGAAIESACLGAAAAGSPLTFVPAAAEDIQSVGRLTPTQGVNDPVGKRLAPYLEERRTARTRHLHLPVPPVVQLALRREAVGSGCRLHIATEQAAIERLAGLSRRATIEQYDNGDMRAEVAAWYRLTGQDGERYLDGVPSECLELRGRTLIAARWALSEATRNRLRRWGAVRVLALREWSIARHSAAFCLVTAQSTDRIDMVRSGRLLIRLWLLAAEAGLNTHAVNVFLQSDDVTNQCLGVFNARDAVPACIFRLGFCPPVAASPRLDPRELLCAPEGSPVSSTREARR